jgi:ferredoxin
METLSLIYYSPTGTTQKIVREIGRNMGLELISEYNMTENETRSIPKASDNCLTIIGLPVYAGRLPITTIDTLKKLESNQSPVVIVVVYGNRDYDDSLLELKDIASNCGFKVVAGAAFIGEHSYSSDEKPIAKNRPDKQDLEKCSDFAQILSEKLKDIEDVSTLSEIDIPGNYPYKERNQLPASIYPDTDIDRCTLCGICVDSCPTNAISIQETLMTNGELCTLCCACIKNCPEEARKLDNPTINGFRENLILNCSARKEPVCFV